MLHSKRRIDDVVDESKEKTLSPSEISSKLMKQKYKYNSSNICSNNAPLSPQQLESSATIVDAAQYLIAIQMANTGAVPLRQHTISDLDIDIPVKSVDIDGLERLSSSKLGNLCPSSISAISG